jgi:nitrite reductase (NO-forming)
VLAEQKKALKGILVVPYLYGQNCHGRVSLRTSNWAKVEKTQREPRILCPNMSGKTLTLGLKTPSSNMTPDRKILIVSAISIVAIVIASVSATMVLLPKNDTVILPAARTAEVSNIAPNPVAPPRTHTSPQNVSFTLTTDEVVAVIDTAGGNATYRYWTFNRTVPGPMLRVIKGDNVTIRIVNPASSGSHHSIDLHAVIGPGGGANFTQNTAPGTTTSFKFKATREGLYVYHCATPPVDHHVANGMYGLILVEDPANLLPVGSSVKEFYVVQGEFYTKGNKGPGHHDFDSSEMLSENPDYVVFNGKVGSLVGTGNALTANVNELVRIYFGVGGPNLASSFHIIGEIFDTVYPEGSLKLSTTLTYVQTTLVPGGGSAIVEFTPEVIGSGYWLVDHSLTRAIQKGALGQLIVTGTSNPGIYGFD